MKQRIQSVDILRGITIASMILVNTPGDWGNVYPMLLHSEWHGLTPTDLVFPFFLFIVGISIYFAYKNKTNCLQTYRRITIRSLKLFGLGLFLTCFIPEFPFIYNISELRILGVLQRIGIVFFFSSILYLNFKWKYLLSISIFILVFYFILMGFVLLPDGQMPTFERASNNWALFIDSNLLGSHMWKPDYDPEGFFSTFPAIVTCVLGILSGKLLDGLKNVNYLFLTSILLLFLGYLLNNWFPINKSIWSSSFVLVTSGLALLIIGIIYYFIDIKKIKFGSIFKYVGMNAITIYFLSSFISIIFTSLPKNTTIHSWIYNNIYVTDFYNNKMASMLYALSVVIFYLLLGYVMYRKKIFIKV